MNRFKDWADSGKRSVQSAFPHSVAVYQMPVMVNLVNTNDIIICLNYPIHDGYRTIRAGELHEVDTFCPHYRQLFDTLVLGERTLCEKVSAQGYNGISFFGQDITYCGDACEIISRGWAVELVSTKQ